jgi:uroporphyrinogen decarboxylase
MTAVLKNDLLLRALLREPTPRRPIWLMRQAGRYLPEYRATRARAGSFLAMCTNPQIACEVTLQPVDRFPLDAAILFSDILTIPHAMKLGLDFEAGEGPKFERPVRCAADVDKLWIPDPGRELRYVIDAVALVRRELGGRVPLIGFAGSPWTVGTYMVEGGGSKTFGLIKRMMYESPQVLHRLLEVLARSTVLYLNAQIAAGAQAVMLFDTWGGVLTPAQYEEFSLRYMAKVIDALTRESDGRRVPNIVFTKGGGAWLGKIAAIGCDAVGVDWTTDLAAARKAVEGRVALQGNLDPSALFAPPETLRAETRRVLDSYGAGTGHVFNLGHGITPDVDPERVAVLVDSVQNYVLTQEPGA